MTDRNFERLMNEIAAIYQSILQSNTNSTVDKIIIYYSQPDDSITQQLTSKYKYLNLDMDEIDKILSSDDSDIIMELIDEMLSVLNTNDEKIKFLNKLIDHTDPFIYSPAQSISYKKLAIISS